jgi:hypothetical protein
VIHGWNTEPSAAPLYWRVAITEPGGKVFEVDAPSGDTLQGWHAYAESL